MTIHIVKSSVTGSIVYSGTAMECRAQAKRLNSEWQTGEYVVEVIA